MQDSNSFKKVFLKKLLVGLQQNELSAKNTSFIERRRAVKISADVALAYARDGSNWSRSVINNAFQQEKNKTLVRSILGEEFERLTKPCDTHLTCKRLKSKKILRRSHAVSRIRKNAPKRILASALAKKLLNRRTNVLKCLIPGGESMDELSLYEETVDYIVSLRAQLDVMRRLASVFQFTNCKCEY